LEAKVGQYEHTETSFNIPFTKWGDPIYLIPIGDVHRDADNCDVDKWHEDISKWKALSENNPGRVFFLGMGDYLDFLSTSERSIFTHGLHDTTLRDLDKLAEAKCAMFYEEMKWTAGKWIGMIEGNHHYDFLSGMSSTHRLCDLFGTKYLGINAFIRLSFQKQPNTNKRVSVDLHAHHGRGGGMTEGASVNALERMMHVSEADVYLMGHNHRRQTARRSRFKFGHGNGTFKVKAREVLLVRTGSYQLGYRDGKDGFAAQNCMVPTSMGTAVLELTPSILRRTVQGEKLEESRVLYEVRI
jgi:hypothetical protein